jgi:hypothetical protein
MVPVGVKLMAEAAMAAWVGRIIQNGRLLELLVESLDRRAVEMIHRATKD